MSAFTIVRFPNGWCKLNFSQVRIEYVVNGICICTVYSTVCTVHIATHEHPCVRTQTHTHLRVSHIKIPVLFENHALTERCGCQVALNNP
jgi:hypothetical protein